MPRRAGRVSFGRMRIRRQPLLVYAIWAVLTVEFVQALISRTWTVAFVALATVIVSALVFAWEHAKQVRLTSSVAPNGRKIYDVQGSLFFASVTDFQQQFSPADDPDEVEIDFRGAKLMDHSAIEAVNALAERYDRAGKRLTLRHLSPDCVQLLDKAQKMIEVDYKEDPRYRVADDALA